MTHSLHEQATNSYETLLTRSNVFAKVLPHHLLFHKNFNSPKLLNLIALAAFTVVRKPFGQSSRSSFVRFAQVRRQSNSVWNFLPAAGLRVRLRHTQVLRQGKKTLKPGLRNSANPLKPSNVVTHPARIWDNDFLDKLTQVKLLGNYTDLKASTLPIFPVVDPNPIEHDDYDLKSEFVRLKWAAREEPEKLPKGFLKAFSGTYDYVYPTRLKLALFKIYLDIVNSATSSHKLDSWAHNLLEVAGTVRDYTSLIPYPLDSRQQLSSEYLRTPLASLWRVFKKSRLPGKIKYEFKYPLVRTKNVKSLAQVTVAERLMSSLRTLLCRRKKRYLVRKLFLAENLNTPARFERLVRGFRSLILKYRRSSSLSALQQAPKSIRLTTRADLSIYKSRYSVLGVRQFRLQLSRVYLRLNNKSANQSPAWPLLTREQADHAFCSVPGVQRLTRTRCPSKMPRPKNKPSSRLRGTVTVHLGRLGLARLRRSGTRRAHSPQWLRLRPHRRLPSPQMLPLRISAQRILSRSKSFLKLRYGPTIRFWFKFANIRDSRVKTELQTVADNKLEPKKNPRIKRIRRKSEIWKYYGLRPKLKRKTGVRGVTLGFRSLSRLNRQLKSVKHRKKPRIWPPVTIRVGRPGIKEFYAPKNVSVVRSTLTVSQYRNSLPTSNSLRSVSLLEPNLLGPVQVFTSTKAKFKLTRHPKIVKLSNRQVKRVSFFTKVSRRRVSKINKKLMSVRYLWLTTKSRTAPTSLNYTNSLLARGLKSPLRSQPTLVFSRLQEDLRRKHWVQALKLDKPTPLTVTFLPAAGTEALVYLNLNSSRVSHPTVLTNESAYPTLRPLYSVRFLSSAFAFLDFISLGCPGSDDVAYSFLSEESVMDCVVFPDTDLVKAWMFRRLQNQKSLFQSRVRLNESDLGSEDTDVLVPEYEIHQPYQFNLMRNLTASVAKLPKVLNVSKTWSWLYTAIDDQGDPEAYSPLRVKRIRFKPGYERIWRIGRTSIRELADSPLRYQYRLTPRLQKLYFAARRHTSPQRNLTLEFALLAVKLAQDRWSLTQLLNSRSVFLNGFSCINPSVKLFANDFIQLIVNLKFYIALKWLRSWSEIKRSRVNKIFYRKFKPYNSNNVNAARTPKKNLNLPVWFFELVYVYCDVPKFFELDYFTLSIFVIHEETSLEQWVPSKVSAVDWSTLNMYNWKYIT